MNKLFFAAGFLSVGLAYGMAAHAAQTPNSLVVCRGQQCADVKYTMTKEYFYNQLVDLFDKNVSKEMLMCEADPVSRRCLEPAIRIKANSNVVKTDIAIPSAEIVDVKPLANQATLQAILDFKVKANDTNPRCESALAELTVVSENEAVMMMRGFNCSFTATGNSTLNMTHTLDYVDFDYGTIGAYYTIGAGQAVRGGKSGYTLLRFTEKLPGTTFKLSDANSPEAQTQPAPAEVVVEEKQVRVDESNGSVTVQETAVVATPGVQTNGDVKKTASSVTTTVKKDIDGVKATVKEEVDTAQSTAQKRSDAQALAAAQNPSGSTAVVVEQVTEKVVPAPQTQAAPASQTPALDNNAKMTVKRSVSETQEGDWTISRETVETTTTSTSKEEDPGFWSRFADKAVKIIYLEEPVW